MSEAAVRSSAGRVVAIWRYPVKSMLGEELNATVVTDRGLLGDRSLALVDAETGKVASAKDPRRWPNLFEFRAAFLEPPVDVVSSPLPPVRITLPDGATLSTSDDEIEARLSAAVGRSVRLARSPFAGATGEGYVLDVDWLPQRDQVFEIPIPPGTFFDCALVHLVTTATLDRLRAQAPSSRFEVRRFRPNLVIQTPEGSHGFTENDWIGHTLELGGVRLRIDRPTERCVMTTLPQSDLPKDPSVLRAAVRENEGNVGVYATVEQAGWVRRGDAVELS
jgi:uncharacterized protein YcbX